MILNTVFAFNFFLTVYRYAWHGFFILIKETVFNSVIIFKVMVLNGEKHEVTAISKCQEANLLATGYVL